MLPGRLHLQIIFYSQELTANPRGAPGDTRINANYRIYLVGLRFFGVVKFKLGVKNQFYL